MSDDAFDVDAWLRRIGHAGPRTPDLATLRAVIAAHTATIPFENIDVLLGRPPKLDLASLQHKMIANQRGGYCFEQNALLHAGLSAMGFQVTGLLARVIRGMEPDAAGAPTHMALRVTVREGAFLADVGFGNQTPTAPLALSPRVEQSTPHDTMRLWPVGMELTLQVKSEKTWVKSEKTWAKSGKTWESIYRVSPTPRLSIDYEVANWYTATHPASLFVNNLIAARAGPDGTRQTLFNGRITVRRAGAVVERFTLDDAGAYPAALESRFGLTLSDADLTGALEALDRKGTRDAQHPFFG